MKIAVVGATGLVGSEMLKVLSESSLANAEILVMASEASVGKSIAYQGRVLTVKGLEDTLASKPDIALFSAGGATSLRLAPEFAKMGCRVIDNSSAWRMDAQTPLVVPEVNGSVLREEDRIIANPNCSTIQMVMVLKPLHERYGIKRVVVSTYQSVTGTGIKAVNQLMAERAGDIAVAKVYPHPIDMNVLPHIDVFQENGYTKEEMKMILETAKIMGTDAIKVTATTVRVPAIGGHSEAVNLELERDFDLTEVRSLLSSFPGLVVMDKPENNVYPMPILAHGRNEVFVGRIRRDNSLRYGLNLWIVADNLRKGAATNAVQIAEYIVSQGWVKP